MSTPSPRIAYVAFRPLYRAALSPMLVNAANAQATEAAAAVTRRTFDEPSGNLAEGLEKFVRQSGAQVTIGDARIARHPMSVGRLECADPR